jgi:hypothetical protein
VLYTPVAEADTAAKLAELLESDPEPLALTLAR